MKRLVAIVTALAFLLAPFPVYGKKPNPIEDTYVAPEGVEPPGQLIPLLLDTPATFSGLLINEVRLNYYLDLETYALWAQVKIATQADIIKGQKEHIHNLEIVTEFNKPRFFKSPSVNFNLGVITGAVITILLIVLVTAADKGLNGDE